MTVVPYEMTLRQWIDSRWFRGFARASMILTSFMFTCFLVVWGVVAGDTLKRVQNLELVIAGDVDQADNAHLVKRGSIAASVTSLEAQVSDLTVDLKVVKQLLQEAARRDVAALPALHPRDR